MARMPSRLPGRELEAFVDKVNISDSYAKQGELFIYSGTAGEVPLNIYDGTTRTFRVDYSGQIVSSGPLSLDYDGGTIMTLRNDMTSGNIIDIKSSPTASSTATVMNIEADGTNWVGGSRVVRIISDDLHAVPLIVNDGTQDVIALERDGDVVLRGNVELLDGGKVISTANGNIEIAPDGTGKLLLHPDGTGSVEFANRTTANPEFIFHGYYPAGAVTTWLAIQCPPGGVPSITAKPGRPLRLNTDGGLWFCRDLLSDTEFYWGAGAGDNYYVRIKGRNAANTATHEIRFRWGDGTKDRGIIEASSGDLWLKPANGSYIRLDADEYRLAEETTKNPAFVLYGYYPTEAAVKWLALQVPSDAIPSITAQPGRPLRLHTDGGLWLCRGMFSDIDFCEMATAGINKYLRLWGRNAANTATHNLRFRWGDGTTDDGFIETSSGNIQIKPASGSYVRLIVRKDTTGDPTGYEGMIYYNTVDNVLKMYCDGGWRTLATWV